MKKISFRSILLRPSYCARLIRSHDFKALCYRWNRRILWATLTMETNRKPSRIVIRKYGESHQEPCSGSSGDALVERSADQAADPIDCGFKLPGQRFPAYAHSEPSTFAD